MVVDLQKANFGKRIIAAIFDGILLSIVVVGVATLLSMAFGYDTYINDMNDAYARYETEYGVKFQITQTEYEALSETEQENFNAAYQAFSEDGTVVYAYNMLLNLTLLITTFSLLLGMIALEFVVPLLFGNGQTLGKKVFGIGLMHVESIEITGLQLFARTVLGKFAIELMIPVCIILLLFFGNIGITGLILLAALLIAQIVCLAVTRTFSPLHDVLASTVAVDILSQRIFKDRDELLAFKKARQAEQAARAEY